MGQSRVAGTQLDKSCEEFQNSGAGRVSDRVLLLMQPDHTALRFEEAFRVTGRGHWLEQRYQSQSFRDAAQVLGLSARTQ